MHNHRLALMSYRVKLCSSVLNSFCKEICISKTWVPGSHPLDAGKFET